MNWKPTMKRKRSFASAVKKRDKQCLVCGSKSGLCAHHIVPRVVGGLDIPENGATYCRDHHKLEHSPSGSAIPGLENIEKRRFRVFPT
jgi:5-methylcytosine-specific restriction endonuclease McrA